MSGPSGAGQIPGGEAEATATGDIARLRAERDAAVAALAATRDIAGRRRDRRATVRRMTAVVLVILFAILLPVTITATWARRTVLNTSGYLAVVTPIGASPAVHAVVSREATDAIYAALKPEQLIAGVLPPKVAPLAGPLSSGARGFIQDSVGKVLATPAFGQLWVAANQFGHEQLVRVLNGDAATVRTTGGQVVLNLVPLLNEALRRVQTRASALLGRNVTLPSISAATIPAASCRKIAAAIRRPLPSTCGQIPLFPAPALTTAQRAVRAINGIVVMLLIVTPLIFAAALWASPRRRRTLLQLTLGGLLGLVVVRRLLYWLQSGLLDRAKPGNRAALEVIMHHVLAGFFTVTMWFLIGGLVLAAAALLLGPYRWAVAVRSRGRRVAAGAGHLVSLSAGQAAGNATSDATLAWVRRHLDILRVGAAVVAALAVLLIGVGWAGFPWLSRRCSRCARSACTGWAGPRPRPGPQMADRRHPRRVPAVRAAGRVTGARETAARR